LIKLRRTVNIRRALLSAMAALIVLAGAGPASAQVVIKLGTLAPEGSPWHSALLKIQQRWSEISGGKVTLRIYAGGVAGDEPDMIRKMKIGQLHAAALTTAKLRTVVPDLEAAAFPLLVRDDDELDFVTSRIRQGLEQQLEAKGYKVLTWASAGWVHFFSKQAVISPDDMRERKLFFWGSDTTYIDLLKNSGFNPVGLAVTDLLPSLQTGLVDTFGAPPTLSLAFQWFALAPHMSTLRWQPLQSVTLITTRKWEEIPEELRGPLAQAAEEVGRSLQTETRALEEKAISVMKEHGLTVHEVPPDVYAQWQKLVQEKGYPTFVGKRFSKEMYDKVLSAIEEYRAKAKPAP
jgi:TRAP-type transport system periplasmic protein